MEPQAWIMMVLQGCVVLLLAIIAFMLRRWVDRVDSSIACARENLGDHEIRLTVLEKDHERRVCERRSADRRASQP